MCPTTEGERRQAGHPRYHTGKIYYQRPSRVRVLYGYK